jgi:hypothetical protein
MPNLDLDIQIRDLLGASTAVTALLANGANSILPKAVAGNWVQPGTDSATPFLIIQLGVTTGLDNIVGVANFDLGIYDDINQGFGRINDLISAVRQTLLASEGLLLQPDTLGYAYLHIQGGWATQPAVDDATHGGWNKNMRLVRFSADLA